MLKHKLGSCILFLNGIVLTKDLTDILENNDPEDISIVITKIEFEHSNQSQLF